MHFLSCQCQSNETLSVYLTPLSVYVNSEPYFCDLEILSTNVSSPMSLPHINDLCTLLIIILSYHCFRNPNTPISQNIHWPTYQAQCNDAVLMRSNLSLIDYHKDTYHFWHETVATLQSLTLRHGYSFAPEIVCLNSKEKFNYKVAFFVTLALGIVLLILLCLACFVQLTIRREIKAKMVEMNSGGKS